MIYSNSNICSKDRVKSLSNVILLKWILFIFQTAAAFYGHSGSFTNSKFHYTGSSLYDFTAPQNMSPSNRMGAQQSLVQSMSGFNSLGSSNLSDIQRIRDEFSTNRLKMSWDETSLPTRSVSIYS